MTQLALMMLALPVSAIQSDAWPNEAALPDMALLDASAELHTPAGTVRNYAKNEFNLTLQDGKSSQDGLLAALRALPPREAFHEQTAERAMVHPSMVNGLASSTVTRATRTYATGKGSLNVEVSIFNSTADAEAFIARRISGGPAASPDDYTPAAFEFGDASWKLKDSNATAIVRDGQVVTIVRLPDGLSPDSLARLRAIVQCVRFRLMVRSGLLVGGGEKNVSVLGVSLEARDFGGVTMAPLSELRRVGFTVWPSAVGTERRCRVTYGDKTMSAIEYSAAFSLGGVEGTFVVAPFAYDGDLWLPLQDVVREFDLAP